MNVWLMIAALWTFIGVFLVYYTHRWERFSGTPATWGPIDYRYDIQAAKAKMKGLILAVPINDTLRFRLRVEKAWDRFGKYTGLCREWQTADGPFDDRIYILSDDVLLHQALSSDPELRNTVSRLLALQELAYLEMDRGMLLAQIQFKDRSPSEDDAPRILEEEAARVLPDLIALRDRFDSRSGEPWSAARDPHWGRYHVGVALLGAFGAAGVVLTVLEHLSDAPPILIEHQHIYLRSAVFMGIVGLVLLALLFGTTGRRSRSHLLLGYLLLVALPGAWLSAEAYFERRNFADTGAATAFETFVESKHISRSRRSRSYHLILAQLPGERTNADLRVDSYTYDQIPEQQCVRLQIREGALGDAFIESLESHACKGPLDTGTPANP